MSQLRSDVLPVLTWQSLELDAATVIFIARDLESDTCISAIDAQYQEVGSVEVVVYIINPLSQRTRPTTA